MARAFGSYPKCHRFKSSRRYQNCKPAVWQVYIYGPLVKRLRHRPFTAVTRVRVSYGSPPEWKSRGKSPCFFIQVGTFGSFHMLGRSESALRQGFRLAAKTLVRRTCGGERLGQAENSPGSISQAAGATRICRFRRAVSRARVIPGCCGPRRRRCQTWPWPSVRQCP